MIAHTSYTKKYSNSKYHLHQGTLDTYYRQKHLAQIGKPESIDTLIELANQLGAIDEEAVRAKIEAEKTREKEHKAVCMAIAGVKDESRKDIKEMKEAFVEFVDAETPESKKCVECGEEKIEAAYSKTQWARKQEHRCMACIGSA